ncbi:hypothetical protein C4K38_3558 [Pseudomonas chlororaphis subsp. piscium]|uniref:hypothetical protein n=1 Tax=Pseudomonas chlororaphis TaxID=587753 RepID=UPI0006A5EA3B|nr:hypothetical protein [Pseudomonas chlororaphis]AZC31517.1 hypothetical protein C4K38_3558 [Pseudomonas chlororaphis subsp. piscium]WDG89305.1 hypothetical protein PUP49_18550 [Pseudomonas chlororaphis]SDS89942.1 hypothetical protein SAMN05216585_3828 [Pseudomonas chlororaphis]
MEVTALTGLILQINSLIDSGKYNDITISDVHNAIESQRLLRFIKEKCGTDIDLSIYLESRAYGDFEDFYEEKINQIYNGYAGDENRKWGIRNLGLCLVLAWTNEIIQWGEGLQLSTRG